MSYEYWPQTRLRIWACQHSGCNRGVKSGRYFCDEHLKPELRQSEPVSPKLAARNALVMAGECYVYAVDGGGLIKIGKAMDVGIRFSSLRTSSPVELTLLGSIRGPKSLERDIHSCAASHRERGEWFAKSARVMDLVDAIVSGDLDRLKRMIKTLDS